MIEITDADLLLRLTNYEVHFVERKTSGDSKDLLKTVVGFANSAPIGYPAVLYIGVKDGGAIEMASTSILCKRLWERNWKTLTRQFTT